MNVDVAYIAVRAASFIAMFQSAGIALFIAWFGRALANSDRALRRLGFWSASVGLILVVVTHTLEAARMTGELSGAWDQSMQMQVMHSTTMAATTTRTMGLVAIAAAFALSGFELRLMSVVGTVVMAAAFTLTGHTTTHSPRWMLVSLLLIHLVVVAFWFGALPGLYFSSRRESISIKSAVIASFSKAAVWLVPCIAVAGIGMAFLLLPDFSALWQPYGLLLLVKIGAFATLMLLAALNKLRLGPRVATGEVRALRDFHRSLAAEYVLIAGALIVTAVLTSLYSPEP